MDGGWDIAELLARYLLQLDAHGSLRHDFLSVVIIIGAVRSQSHRIRLNRDVASKVRHRPVYVLPIRAKSYIATVKGFLRQRQGRNG